MLERLIDHSKATVRSGLFGVVARIGRRIGYPAHHQNYERLVRSFYLKDLYDQIEQVEGDVAECGVAYGNSLIVLCALAQQERKGRVVYGFDSFEGFPDPTVEDTSVRRPKKGDFRDATLERVVNAVREAGVTPPVLAKGFFQDTLPTFKRPLAFLHIDGDLYSSYNTVLTELFDQVVHGGIVAFDEYREAKWPGATRAIDEFLAGRYAISKAKHLDKYYVVKK